jgi:hypothetical protein
LLLSAVFVAGYALRSTLCSTPSSCPSAFQL